MTQLIPPPISVVEAAEGRVNVKLLYKVTVDGTPACLTVVETLVTIL